MYAASSYSKDGGGHVKVEDPFSWHALSVSSVDLPVLVIDGSRFDDFEGLAREFSSLLPGWTWNGNLDAFDDILHGGFGTPDQGFVLRWVNSDRSRQVLGWQATEAWLAQTLQTCHPTNRSRLQTELEAVRQRTGTTLFDWIIEIVRSHGPVGEGDESPIYLELA